jgi:hypothetical protein
MDKGRHRLGLALLASGVVLGALIAAIVVTAPGTSLWVNSPVPVAKNDRPPLLCRCPRRLSGSASPPPRGHSERLLCTSGDAWLDPPRGLFQSGHLPILAA